MTQDQYIQSLDPGQHFTIKTMREAEVEDVSLTRLNQLCRKVRPQIERIQSGGGLNRFAIWRKL